MVLGGPLSKHENEPKRPILLELRSSKVFVIFVVAFATFTVSWQQEMVCPKKNMLKLVISGYPAIWACKLTVLP